MKSMFLILLIVACSFYAMAGPKLTQALKSAAVVMEGR